MVGTANPGTLCPRPLVADHVPDVDPAGPDALRQRGEPEEVLVAVDVDQHGHPAKVGLKMMKNSIVNQLSNVNSNSYLEGVSVDEEGLESVGKAEDVGLPVDVDALPLGVDDQLHVAGGEAEPVVMI